jgi:hypothetical protein
MTPQSEASRLIELFGINTALMVVDEIMRYDTDDTFFWVDVKSIIREERMVPPLGTLRT